MADAFKSRHTWSRSGVAAGVALLAILYCLGAAGRAHQKLFWHDEIMALTLARLPPRLLWAALRDGADLNPPLFHLILKFWHSMVGEGGVLSRVPTIAGVAIAAGSVGIFVGRRLGAIAGGTAALLLLTTQAYEYAYEARPYGVMLGFAGAALVCWQGTTGAARRGWLAGLFICSAGALATHYYAVLLLPALFLGITLRSIENRRVDWSVAGVLVASMLPFLLFWPLVSAARSFSHGYFSPPTYQELVATYESAFSGLIVPFVVTIAASGALLAWLRPRTRDLEPSSPAIPLDEWGVALALLAVPVLGYLLAVLVTGAFVPRYFLLSTLGFSIVVTYLLASFEATRVSVLPLLAGVLLVFVAARDASSARLLLASDPDLRLVYPSLLDNRDESLPIVISNGHVFLAVVHYAPKELGSRVVYLFRPESLTTGGQPRYLKALSRWDESVHMEELNIFLTQHHRFLVYGPATNAVLSEVRRRKGRAVLEGMDVDRSLFAVSRPGPCGLFEVTLDDLP